MSLEFEIAGQRYRAEKLDAFKQLHVSRKIAPIIPKLLPMFLKFAGNANALKEGDVSALKEDLSGLAEAFEPLAQALADMPDADCEYVFGTCFSVVCRYQQNGWTTIWIPSVKSLMFDDIDLGAMFQIASRVIMDSLGPFIRGLLANKAESPQPASNG